MIAHAKVDKESEADEVGSGKIVCVLFKCMIYHSQQYSLFFLNSSLHLCKHGYQQKEESRYHFIIFYFI